MLWGNRIYDNIIESLTFFYWENRTWLTVNVVGAYSHNTYIWFRMNMHIVNISARTRCERIKKKKTERFQLRCEIFFIEFCFAGCVHCALCSHCAEIYYIHINLFHYYQIYHWDWIYVIHWSADSKYYFSLSLAHLLDLEQFFFIEAYSNMLFVKFTIQN